MPPLQPHDPHETLVDQLATVLSDLDEARELVRSVGFPPPDVPFVKTARVFWSLVIQGIRDGKITGGVEPVIEAAAKRFPGNAVFARLRSEASVTGAPNGLDRPSPSPRLHIGALRHDALRLFGRERELAELDAAWSGAGSGKTNVMVLVAAGGVGKTSLVKEWINQLRDAGWRGAEVVYAHSFYSQGVRDRCTASADAFVSAALGFFGDPELAPSNASAHDKGARLAELVGRQRTLLVLDGLEPLQQPPRNGVYAGELKDPALRSLLEGLTNRNRGLCVVTTREAIHDLRSAGRTVVEKSLEQLSPEAGSDLIEFLLESDRFKGSVITSTTSERAEICEAVEGHAFTLQLLGRYLRRRRWDVRRWRLVRFEAADASVAGGHAFRMLGAYERWLAGEDGETVPDGHRQLAVLRLLGFFDRPADPACIGALCEAPAIEGLTEPLVDLDEEGWDDVLADLEGLGLVRRTDWEPPRIRGFRKEQTDLDTGKTDGEPAVMPVAMWSRLSVAFDAHPLVRAHFGRRVKETSEVAWVQGHRRVFEHLCKSTPHWPEGDEGLRPLYQAGTHGCQAGELQRTFYDVYIARILRGTSAGGFYSTRQLGTFGADLGAVAWFFASPWSRLAPGLSDTNQAWLLNQAAFRLRALGRFAEAVEPMRAGFDAALTQKNWKSAATYAVNLSELRLTRGEVALALQAAEQSVAIADQSEDAYLRMLARTAHADALHHSGRFEGAQQRFEEAEAMQAEQQPPFPRLYSLGGYQYCELLLSEAERAAWRVTAEDGCGRPSVRGRRHGSRAHAACNGVLERADHTMKQAQQGRASLVSIAINGLTLCRASLYRALVVAHHQELTDLATTQQRLDDAIDGLRRSDITYLPRGLLSRAWLHHVLANPTAAATDLAEAESIATRCGMPIFLADVHLTRARLFHDHTALATARTLLADLATRGYHRHDDMLEDADAAAEHWPT